MCHVKYYKYYRYITLLLLFFFAIDSIGEPIKKKLRPLMPIHSEKEVRRSVYPTQDTSPMETSMMKQEEEADTKIRTKV